MLKHRRVKLRICDKEIMMHVVDVKDSVSVESYITVLSWCCSNSADAVLIEF